MKFKLYDSLETFGGDVLDILLEREAQNNLPVSFIKSGRAAPDWLMASVKNENGDVLLTAAMTPPFNLVLFETRNRPNDAALAFLSRELKALGRRVPGIIAEQGLAERFALAHAGEQGFERRLTMKVMRLDRVNDLPKAPGRCRPLTEDDLFFVPYWERAFEEECRVEVFGIPEAAEKVRGRVGRDGHYIWEDGVPVSQAVSARATVNGAGINGVYTPPFYRGRGYASSLVGTLSQMLLDRGNKFCCLFADAANPISCGIYRKLGYRDECVSSELKFIQSRG